MKESTRLLLTEAAMGMSIIPIFARPEEPRPMLEMKNKKTAPKTKYQTPLSKEQEEWNLRVDLAKKAKK